MINLLEEGVGAIVEFFTEGIGGYLVIGILGIIVIGGLGYGAFIIISNLFMAVNKFFAMVGLEFPSGFFLIALASLIAYANH